MCPLTPACRGCGQPATLRRRITLDQATDELPALAERALERGVTQAAWDVYECDHCDCDCRRLVPALS